jgi:hypothetical protein
LREFRTVDASRMLRAVAKEKDLTKTSLQHIKSVLSTIFTYAKNEGAFAAASPGERKPPRIAMAADWRQKGRGKPRGAPPRSVRERPLEGKIASPCAACACEPQTRAPAQAALPPANSQIRGEQSHDRFASTS